MAAAVGANVGIYMDTSRDIASGDVIRTRSGRYYLVDVVREQQRGIHVGRKHMRVVVIDARDVPDDAVIHPLLWYRRG